jgi:hypothetical protein
MLGAGYPESTSLLQLYLWMSLESADKVAGGLEFPLSHDLKISNMEDGLIYHPTSFLLLMSWSRSQIG